MILAGGHAGAETGASRRGEAIARLQHPNIVQVYEVGEHEGCRSSRWSSVEGGSLDTAGRHAAASRSEAAPGGALARRRAGRPRGGSSTAT